MPDRIPIAGAGFDIETALGRQHAGEGDTCLACALADSLVGLRSIGQEVLEKRPGTSIEFVASADILVRGHFAFLSGNPPAYGGRADSTGGCGTHVPFQCRL